MKLRLIHANKPATPLDEAPGTLRALSPEDLAARAASGSVASFGELVGRFEGRVFNFLLRKMGSRTDAEDLAQEAFVRAWERIGSYDRRWRFSTWLFTIASRLAVSHYRRQRPVISMGELDRAEVLADTGRDGEADRKLGAHLWALAAETLGEDQHEALWLRYAEDMEIAEIASVMGKSHVSVRVCLFRARQALASAWKEKGDMAADAKGVTLSARAVDGIEAVQGVGTQGARSLAAVAAGGMTAGLNGGGRGGRGVAFGHGPLAGGVR